MEDIVTSLTLEKLRLVCKIHGIDFLSLKKDKRKLLLDIFISGMYFSREIIEKSTKGEYD